MAQQQKVYIFAWRKPSLTPAEFKTHYETIHMPLIKSLAGDLFPTSHTRHYMTWFPTDPRAEVDRTAPGGEAAAEAGKFDAWAELVFPSAEALAAFTARSQEPDFKARLAEDERLFLDQTRMCFGVVNDVQVTRGSDE